MNFDYTISGFSNESDVIYHYKGIVVYVTGTDTFKEAISANVILGSKAVFAVREANQSERALIDIKRKQHPEYFL